VRRPELLVQPVALDGHLHQARAGDRFAQQPPRDPVGLVFVLPRQRKGLGHEARKVPAQEALRDGADHALVAFQVLVQAGPAEAGAVNPRGKTPMVAAQMAVFVREDGEEALVVHRHQQRQADGEMVARAAEQAPARSLRDAGVQVAIQPHLVHGRSLDAFAHALDRLEQRGCVARLQPHAVGRLQLEPECPQAGPQQAGRGHDQPEVPAAKASLHGCRAHPPKDAGGQAQATQYPGITKRRERRDAAAVAHTVFGARMFTQSNQVHEVGTFHPHPPGRDIS
jgi:hypothetical protein